MNGDGAIDVGGRFAIPEAELTWRFTTSGGAGGQHANRANTRAELSWDLGSSGSVPDDLREHLAWRLRSRLRDGVVTVVADDTRSQWQNRALARRRLADLLTEAARRKRPRKPTLPTRASRERRLEAKRRRAERKRLRRAPEEE